MLVFTFITEALTAFALFATAACFLIRPHAALTALRHFPSAMSARVLFAILALIPGFALGLSIFIPFLAFFAAVFSGSTAVTLGLYAVIRGSRNVWPLVTGIALASLLIAGLQPLGLKIMLLPKADDLPYEPVQAHVVKTYDEGVWFESVRVGSDGTLYLAANIGLDFSRTDYFHKAHGQVIARRPDGSERILFTTPTGSAAGAFAVAPDGTLYMPSNGVTPGIWRIDQDGRGEMFVHLPQGAWPNGLDFGPDGNLYSPDSALGLVWRINPITGHAEPALKHPSLSARPFIALAPGGNGLHFSGRTMIVTVSDSARILRFEMNKAGVFSGPVELARGIPGDDFAIGQDGSLFVTTHPYNTLVRVAPDGRRSIVADARQQIIGATDAVFGITDADRSTLYVVTDGGAFTGGPKTRGQLVALSPYATR
ncbi:SMP-30/gluconolactonase/LRE family protein [Methylobacterium sp. NEAU K]|uniref:SMP-30/gluconolactonase/LRE family protein n=1 Tax=Methylobacterium sp. NEAU K TaxID=3064946 RepID=UPI0027337BAC|nr:hypothetical protein [Methylobacterium sp. NEAU K]MDP4004812.1 hypothetical protein [Methylobacterium sp. NEAU K]